MSRRFGAGLWRLADPKVSLASFSGLLLGACAAAREGPVSIPWLLLTILGIFAIEVAKNASGEIVDFDSGADLAVAPEDRSPFSGGKRVLVDGLLTRRQTAAIAAIFYAAGIAAGLWIVSARDRQVLPLGILGVAAALFYHSRPLRLAYRGLGEAVVWLAYGPLVVSGTYLVQRGRVEVWVVWLSFALGLAIADFLVVNEFPDARADAQAGKRTLVVRLGRARSATLFAALAAAAFGALLLSPLAGAPAAVWLGLAGAFPAARAALILRAHPETTSRIIPAQRFALLAFLLLAVGAGLGLLVGR
jgi:1,4-dihydroxy-2-naphthoate octaprenyltransferase